MINLTRILVAMVIVIVLGGGAFLAMWNIPAPVAEVEKVLPDDRFPR